MTRGPGPLLLAAGVLLGAGAASALTALATYFARYSAFDSIEGEVPFALYVAVTRMAPVEKAAVVLGGALVVLALVLLLGGRVRAAGRSR